jgi:hypothetical protein
MYTSDDCHWDENAEPPQLPMRMTEAPGVMVNLILPGDDTLLQTISSRLKLYWVSKMYNRLTPLPSAVQTSKELSIIRKSTFTLPLVDRLALFPKMTCPYGGMMNVLRLNVGGAEANWSTVLKYMSLRAIVSLPELYTSNQRVLLLVAALGLTMISEIFKSLGVPLTTWAP